MKSLVTSPRGWILGIAILLGAATLAFAQLGGAGPGPNVPKVMEYTHQEVQADLLVQTLNELGKQNWDVFQVIPSWKVSNNNGEAELIPKAYQIIGRRTAAPK